MNLDGFSLHFERSFANFPVEIGPPAFLCRLVHGLDYKGNVCGDRKATPGLRGFDVLYWVNPTQLYLSGDRKNPFKLSNARSICLRDCPRLGNATNVAWVCDYPEPSILSNFTMSDWSRKNYNYFDRLTPDQQASSKNFAGPCYPVLFQSTNGMVCLN